MRMEFLLLVAGAVAAPPPPPLGLLDPQDAGPPKISCFAPRSFAGSTFELFAVGADVPARILSAEPGQHRVDFTLDDAAPAARCYRCRYRSFNGSAWRTSAFSTDIAVNASDDAGCDPLPTGQPLPTSATLRRERSWLLPVASTAAGLVLLLLVAAAVAWRGSRRRAKRKRGASPPVRLGDLPGVSPSAPPAEQHQSR